MTTATMATTTATMATTTAMAATPIPAATSETSMTKDTTVQCATCHASGIKLWHCSRCRQAAYCGRDCQVRDWPTHRTRCCKLDTSTAAVSAELACRLKAATVLARQKEGRMISHCDGFRHHEKNDFLEHRKQLAAYDRRIAPALWFQKVGYWDTKRNNWERGSQVRGQGCRQATEVCSQL